MDLCRKSEVKQFDFSIPVHHHIGGLDIPVKHLHAVGEINCLCRLTDEFESLFFRKIPRLFDSAEIITQFLTLNILHNKQIFPAGLIKFKGVVIGDVGMVKFVDDLVISLDLPHFPAACGKLRGKGLDRHFCS